METMPPANMSLCISYVPGIFDMERGKDFDVVHYIDVVLGVRQWEASHISAGWRYCCDHRRIMCIVGVSV